MNLHSILSIWKEAQLIGEKSGESGEDVLINALKLYKDSFNITVVENNEPLNQFIEDIDIFINYTLRDKNSIHYNFVLQFIESITKCEKPDSGFEFRINKMVHILYKKNKEYSKVFLDNLGVTREELQEEILNKIFTGDV